MNYTLYKITNTINGKIYVGVHKTNDINDGYMGSGKILKRAIEKYGEENFDKEILEVYETQEEMFAAEAKLVNEEFVADKETYNIKLGGFGGFDYIRGHPKYAEWQAAACCKGGLTQHITDEDLSNRIRTGLLDAIDNGYNPINNLRNNSKCFKGSVHTQETKDKIGKANSIHQTGKGNSQYGTRWIHNLEVKKSKKIKKEDLLPEGWIEGRKIKF